MTLLVPAEIEGAARYYATAASREELPAVTQLLYAMRRFETAHRADDLIWISSNGQVDAGEQERIFKETLSDLQDIVRAAMQLRIAQGTQSRY